MKILTAMPLIVAGLVLSSTASAAIINYNIVDDFVAGPSPQLATNSWQYFEMNDSRTTATLLSDWDTDGNEIMSGSPQWDNNRVNDNYPFVQLIGAGGDNGNSGSGFFDENTLWLHAGNNVNELVGVGWFNNTGLSATVNYVGALTSHDKSSVDGVDYFVMHGLGTALLESGTLADPSGGGETVALTGNNILMAPGEYLYFGLESGANKYAWDHTQLTLALTADTIAVPEPSILSIFALGLMGLASRRFKKQA
jgi:hypothetical protein